MSQADRAYTISLDAYDAATLQLSQAIAILHCIHCAGDPDNQNVPTRPMTQEALDGATTLVERARELLKQRPRQPVVVGFAR